MSELKTYRVTIEEVKTILIHTDSPEGAVELATDYFYDKLRTLEQGVCEPVEDNVPVDGEKIYLDPDHDTSEVEDDE